MRGPLKALAISVVSISGLAALAPPAAHSSIENPQRINQAVSAFLTTKGQRYIQNNLEDILFLNGYAFNVGQYDLWEYNAEEEIDLNNLPGRMQAHQATLNRVRAAVREWLHNTSINNPLFELDVENIQWALQFDGFRVENDLDRLRELGADNSAVFVFEATIPELRIDVARIMGRDLHNDFLGEIGLRRVFAEFGQNSVPLRVSVSARFAINREGGLSTEILDIQSNIEDITVTSGFGAKAADCPQPTSKRNREEIARREECQSWLKVPAMGFHIGTKYMPLNTATLERRLLAQKDALMRSLQVYLDEYSSENAPAKLTEFAARKMPRGFFDVSEMVPPGAPDNLPATRKFRWALNPQSLHQEERFTRIGLSAWVEDPYPVSTVPNLPITTSGRVPRVPDSKLQSNDLVLALNQDFVNRIVQQSYLRGYLREFAVPGSNPIRLVSAPRLVIDGMSTGNQATLKLDVETDVDGIGSALVKNPLRMQFDMRVRLGRSNNGGLKIAMDRVLLNSIEIDSSRITWGWDYFRARVIIATRDKFRAFNEKIAQQERLLVEDFQVLETMFGIPLRLEEVGVDGNGFILFHMNFGSELG